MTAKTVSKRFKIILSLMLVTTFVLKWVGIIPDANASDIIACYLTAYALVAGTIDMNIMLDNIKRKGDKHEHKTDVLPY